MDYTIAAVDRALKLLEIVAENQNIGLSELARLTGTTKTLAFTTPNVMLFIRDMDPAVCGKALRLAEGTVRALQVFLRPTGLAAQGPIRPQVAVEMGVFVHADDRAQQFTRSAGSLLGAARIDGRHGRQRLHELDHRSAVIVGPLRCRVLGRLSGGTRLLSTRLNSARLPTSSE